MNNILIVGLLILSVSCIDPPVWPQHFSQGMTVNFGDLVTTGKLWYDSAVDAQRYDFANGNSRTGCGAVHPMNTPCSYLTANKMIYMVYPERELCCKAGQSDIFPRNWLSNFTYSGQKSIGDQQFHVWTSSYDEYYADKGDSRIPRRQVNSNRVFLDYWMSSYSQKPIDKSVFNIPTYCQKYCYERIHNKEELKNFYQHMSKFHYNFKIPEIKNQQQSTKNLIQRQ